MAAFAPLRVIRPIDVNVRLLDVWPQHPGAEVHQQLGKIIAYPWVPSRAPAFSELTGAYVCFEGVLGT